MEATQNFADLDVRHQRWIDFCALGGMTLDSEGNVGKQTAEQLAKELKLSRRTLYLWQETIPGFWDYVKERRNSLYARDAVTLVYRSMLKKAAGGDVAAAKLILQQAKVLEAERVDHTTNGKDMPVPIISIARETDAV